MLSFPFIFLLLPPLLLTVVVVTEATPTSPDGLDMATICVSLKFRNSPACKSYNNNNKQVDPLTMCDVFCSTGVIVPDCNCTSSSSSSVGTTTPNSGAASTTELCDYLCDIGEGGSLCDCDAKPPADNRSFDGLMPKEETGSVAGFCKQLCAKGGHSPICPECRQQQQQP